MSTGGVGLNGGGVGITPSGHNGDGARSTKNAPERETIVAAADLLSHFWSRPLPEEVEAWVGAHDFLAETHQLLSSEPAGEPVSVPEDPAESLGLLDEYERLFVGPGQVPCPPYESFWREDVSVDIRRTLMGPCTTELKDLYGELGLQVSSGSGELPDHVAMELEALAYSLSSDETEPVGRRLYTEHLAQFLPRLCRAVAHDAESAFYRDVAALTLDWLAAIKTYFALANSG